MRTILKAAIFPTLLLALTSSAYADGVTYQIGSYANNAYDGLKAGDPGSNANSALSYLGYSSTSTGTLVGSGLAYNIAPANGWLAAIPGSSWVSVADSGSGGVTPTNGYYEYTSTLNVANTGTYDGMIGVLADDTLAMYIDGHQIVGFANGPNSTCQSNEPNCREVDWVPISGLSLTAGSNTITVIDAQLAGYAAGIDFQGHISETPEPSSLLLLGTGLFGLAFFLFRKNKPFGLVLHS